jgi:regulator of ribosome biosynthesis
VEVEAEKDWLLEVPGNADPMEDQFEKRAETKAEKVSKNELQRLKNLARAKKVDLPKVGLVSKERPTKNEVSSMCLNAVFCSHILYP